MERTLSRDAARRFYDAFGARQDAQGRYEDPPNRELSERLELAGAGAVLEFGCGTGRLAERLLAEALPPGARYLALDQSETMVGLARTRLARFGSRAQVERSDGSLRLPGGEASADRFVCTYVLDLLSLEDIRALLAELARVLRPGGLAGFTGLAPGAGPWARCVTALWRAVHRRAPERVGGCRPLELEPLFDPAHWETRHRGRHAWFGLTSAVLVVRRR